MSDRVKPEGVVYRAEDHAGLWRRLLVEAIDVPVVLVASVVIALLVAVLSSWTVDPVPVFSLALAASSFVYLVLMKRTRLRTLGYRLAGVRIVDLGGEVPGVGALTLRLAFAVFGPLNLGLDLLWIPGDERRQALRDKFAHTYVVRAGAHPLGRGPIVYRQYQMMGWAFIFQEVAASAPSGQPAPARSDEPG